ncbi:unnamed protein product [Urochloa decumbens]|uniref:Uncharacterized protein n=1 Tax=Urochloa decumbens TaxID=240449 RepID=A0ABC9BYC8_9POAL
MSISKIASTCVSKREQRTHLFHIKGYSQHRAAGASEFIVSDTFSVGEHGWKLLFFPDGSEFCSDRDCVVAALLLMHKRTKAQSFVEIELRLLDQSTGRSLSVHKEASRVIDTYVPNRLAMCAIKRKLFEEMAYLRDDCLTIESIVTVISKPQVTETQQFPRIEVPPSDIADHFGKLLETKEGVDVTFSVGGIDFTAHKMVLATRSPVFRAELYGPMREGGSEPIVVEDIQPDVFSALLHFIYTDSLPDFDDLKADDYVEMIRHLLVAADRYAMERLKLMCQSILCRSLHVQTLATTLALADQHQCDMLKDACIEFVTSSNAMDDVAATEGYKSLKRTCPFVVIELLEKTSRLRKA